MPAKDSCADVGRPAKARLRARPDTPEGVHAFRLPTTGFYIVVDKVAEADYFLDKMRGRVGHQDFR